MKKLLSFCGLFSPATLFALSTLVIPHGAVIALIFFGGVGALIGGLSAIIFQFIFGFAVQSALTPFEMLLTL